MYAVFSNPDNWLTLFWISSIFFSNK
jgi:hypothetical protein